MEQGTKANFEEKENLGNETVGDAPSEDSPSSIEDDGVVAIPDAPVVEESIPGQLQVNEQAQGAVSETNSSEDGQNTLLSPEEEESLLKRLEEIFAHIHGEYREAVDSFYDSLPQAKKSRVDDLTGSFLVAKRLLQEEVSALIREQMDQDRAADARGKIIGNTHTMFGLMLNILSTFAESGVYRKFDQASGTFTGQIQNLVDRVLYSKYG